MNEHIDFDSLIRHPVEYMFDCSIDYAGLPAPFLLFATTCALLHTSACCQSLLVKIDVEPGCIIQQQH